MTPLGIRGAPNIRDERELDMVQKRMTGWTLKMIADQYGLTRERVRQILLRTGMNPRKYNNPQRAPNASR